MCHMLADTEKELHAMARKIGIARRWYQGDHYDICQSKRALAVMHGAKEITKRQAVTVRAAFRLQNFESAPTTVDYDNDCAP